MGFRFPGTNSAGDNTGVTRADCADCADYADGLSLWEKTPAKEK